MGADESFLGGSGFPQDHHQDLAGGRQRGQEKRGAGHTASPRGAAGVAGADATHPKAAAQASPKPWVPAPPPAPHPPGSSSPRSALYSRAHEALCSRSPGSGVCPARSPPVLHVAHDPSRPLWSSLWTPLCPRGRAPGTAQPPPPAGSPRSLCLDGPGPRVHPTLPGPVHRWPHLPAASARHPSCPRSLTWRGGRQSPPGCPGVGAQPWTKPRTPEL